MYKPFFPNLGFAWAFIALLGTLLVVAAYVDWRRRVIPKWLTLALLVSGVIASVVRAAWLAGEDGTLWLFQTGSPWLGGLDGFLFALVGLLSGFAMLFLLWILGTCGGGDVKLFTALGAWVGPVYAIFVLMASLVVLLAEVLVKMIGLGFSVTALRKVAQKNRREQTAGGPAGGKWRITYSFPVAVATLAVLLWSFRVELGLADPKPQNNIKVTAHAR